LAEIRPYSASGPDFPACVTCLHDYLKLNSILAAQPQDMSERIAMQSAPLPASQPDLAEIQAIYAHHVLHGTGTFEEVPPSLEEIQARWQAGLAAGYDWLVLKDETGLLGYAYTGPFRQRSAYKWTVEDSVYVRDDVRGQGVGRTLVTALVARAEAAGFRQMLALIGDSENTGSIGVHASLGFTRAGVMRACGVKFGRWLDVVIMQRPLGAGDGDVPG
jgi:phosphinothricin acetyltransferase